MGCMCTKTKFPHIMPYSNELIGAVDTETSEKDILERRKRNTSSSYT